MILGVLGMTALALSPAGNSVEFYVERTFDPRDTLDVDDPQAGQTFFVTFGFRDIVVPSAAPGMTGAAMYWTWDNSLVTLGQVTTLSPADFSFRTDNHPFDTPNNTIRIGASGTHTADTEMVIAQFTLTAAGAAEGVYELPLWLHIHTGWDESANTNVVFGTSNVYLAGATAPYWPVNRDFLRAANAPTVTAPTPIRIRAPYVDWLVRDVNEAADPEDIDRDELENLIRDNWNSDYRDGPGLGLFPDLDDLDLSDDDWDRILDSVLEGRDPNEYNTREEIRDRIREVLRELGLLDEGAHIMMQIVSAPSPAPTAFNLPSLTEVGLLSDEVYAGGTFQARVFLQDFTDLTTLSIPLEFNNDFITITNVDVGPAFTANNLEGMPWGNATVGFMNLLNSSGISDWNPATITGAERLFLTLQTTGNSDFSIPDMLETQAAGDDLLDVHHFFTITFRVADDIEDRVTGDTFPLFTPGVARAGEDHAEGTLFAYVDGYAPAWHFCMEDGGPVPSRVPHFPVIARLTRTPDVPTIDIYCEDREENLTGQTTEFDVNEEEDPLVRTVVVNPDNDFTVRIYRRNDAGTWVRIPNVSLPGQGITVDGDEVMFALDTPVGEYRIVAELDDYPGIDATHYVNIIDTTALYITITGTSTLFGKTRADVEEGSVWDFGVNRRYIDMGIRVELINIATGDVIEYTYTEPANTTRTPAANGNPAIAPENNFTMDVPINATVRDLLQSNGTMLRFTRRGPREVTRYGATVVVDEIYLITEVVLVGTAASAIVDGATIDLTRIVRLYAGAMFDARRVGAGDVALIRALVGNEADDYFQVFDINEYWGIDAGDFNSVSRSMGGHTRNEANRNYSFVVTPPAPVVTP